MRVLSSKSICLSVQDFPGLALKSGQSHVVSSLRRPRMPYAMVATT